MVETDRNGQKRKLVGGRRSTTRRVSTASMSGHGEQQDEKEREMTDKKEQRKDAGYEKNSVGGRNLGTLGNQSPLMKIPRSKRMVFQAGQFLS